jgi:signal transduction histidine kinase
MPRNTIYKRLFLPYVLTLLLGLGGAWFASTQLFIETLENRQQSQLMHTVTMLSNGSFPYTPGLLDRLSKLIRADIVLLGPDRDISISTLKDPNNQLAERFDEMLGKTAVALPSVRKFTYSGHSYLIIMDSISDNRDPRVAYVAAFSDLSDLQAANRRIAGWLGTGAFAGLILLAWVGHRISQSMTLPIKELAHMAGEIAVGNRNIRAVVHRADEIGDLASALNAMAEKLNAYENEITDKSRLATLGQLTARIAHEIHNPLTAIKMHLELLKESSDDQSIVVLDCLLDETRRLELIVLSTLQYKRKAKPVFTHVALNGFIEEIVKLLKPQFEHQGLSFTLSLDPALPKAPLDRDMMTQVLLNLLLNAKDEMPEGGTIEISTGTDEDNRRIWFAIDDTGPGIPEQQWSNLFSEPVSIKPSGFGLGLRLCREIAQIHGGEIQVGHSSLGGARFTVFVPTK